MKEPENIRGAFERELAKLKARHPEWFVEPIVQAKESNVSVPAPIVAKTGTKPWSGKERLDWAQRASGERVDMENDGIEP